MKRKLVVDLHEHRSLWSLPAWALAEIRAAVPPGWETVVVDEPADARGEHVGLGPRVRSHLAPHPVAQVEGERDRERDDHEGDEVAERDQQARPQAQGPASPAKR
ncbi:MAG TPA: hypothetical protein VFX98_16845, partial [Longimicrobiaceae bacterium]|nr:hypothetical protein [Longimicrobiaceae bacterium]